MSPLAATIGSVAGKPFPFSERAVVEDHRDVLVDDRVIGVRIGDDEGTQQAHRHLVVGHEVAVIHVGAGVTHGVLVRERLAG